MARATGKEQTDGRGEIVEAQIVRGPLALESPQTALIRLENETQMVMARQNPRELLKVKARLEEEMAAFPDEVDEWIYIKPVGKREVGEGGEARRVQTFARDLSIRAAESLAAHWDNHAKAVTFEENEDSITLTAIWLDCERNQRTLRQQRVSKYMTLRSSGVTVKLADDKLDNRVKAEASKLVRELILRSVPQSLRLWLWNRARAVTLDKRGPDGKPIPLGRRLRSCVESFKAEHGVGEEMLAEVLGHEVGKDLENDLLYLVGIWNILRDETMTVKQVFGVEPRLPSEESPRVAGPASPDPGRVESAQATASLATKSSPPATMEHGAETRAGQRVPPLTADQRDKVEAILYAKAKPESKKARQVEFVNYLGSIGCENLAEAPASKFTELVQVASQIALKLR